MALTLKLAQGTSRDFPLQAYNGDGTPAEGVFEPTDTLSTSVWAGDGLPVVLSPTTTWIDAPLGTFQISFNNSDTSAVPPSSYRLMTVATRGGRSISLLPRESRIVILDVPGSAVTTDLVTQDYVAQALAGAQLTPAQLELLPKCTAAASRAIRRHCNRYFNRMGGPTGSLPPFDGLYTVDWPSKTLLLRQYPVNRVLRVLTNPNMVLSVVNTDTTTNQEAWITWHLTGVEDIDDVPPVVSGLELWRVASGTTNDTVFTWNICPTLTSLATAINTLGGGWSATVTDGYELWSTTKFRAGQGPQPALGQGVDDGVGLMLHTDDVPAQYDGRTGLLSLSEQTNDPFLSPRFGMYLSTDLDDVQVYGGLDGVRVIYDAGWDTVPEDVQDATVETVLNWLQRKTIDFNLGSESDGARSIVINTAFADYALPKSVLGKLAPYRSPRA